MGRVHRALCEAVVSALAATSAEIDVEQSLLGACLINAEAIDSVDGMVAPADFAEPLHAHLFEAIVGARREGRRIDATLVRALIGSEAARKLAPDLSVSDYLTRLAAAAPSVLNARDYARIVAENASYRNIVAAMDFAKGRALLGLAGGSPADIASEAIASLDSLATAHARPTRLSVAEAAATAAEASEERALHGVVSGVTWGLRDLDAVTQLYPGDLTILAARPSMGKTTLGLSTALAAARNGDGVLFFSLEMGSIALGQRVISDLCFDGFNPGIPYADIRDGKLPHDGVERMTTARDRLKGLPLVIEEQAGLTVSQIAARTRTAKARFKRMTGHELGLVVVDHLGLIAPADRYAGARHLELGAMTAALKVLAKDEGLPVLLLCQLSRGVEGRENKRPMLSDLRESGRIEEDADAVVLLYREAYYLERARESDPDKDMARVEKLAACQSILEINVAKQRQGATRSVEAFVSMPNNAVRNMARSSL